MSESLSSLHGVNRFNPCTQLMQYKKECAVTVVAIVAISALVFGVLALSTTMWTPPAGLGFISHIPVPTSGSLVVLGGLALLSLPIWKLYKSCCNQQVHSNDIDSEQSSVPNNTSETKVELPTKVLEAEEQKNISNNILTLLPINTEQDLAQTQACLRELAFDLILKHWQRIPVSHLRLLSDEQLKNPQFPWGEITQSKEKMQAMFSAEFSDLLGTKRILRLLNIDSIRTLLPCLNGEHLSLMSDKQLQDSDFPWDEIAQSEDKEPAMFSNIYPREMERILNLLDKKTLDTLSKNAFLKKRISELSNTSH